MIYLTEFIISFIFTFIVIVITYFMFYKPQVGEAVESNKEETELEGDTSERKELEKDDIDVEDFKDFLIKAEELKELQHDQPELDDEPFVDETFATNIHTMYKSSRLHIKEIEQQMSEDDKEQERIAKQNQLAEIFKLMSQEQEKFGMKSVDEIQDQMKMYSFSKSD